MSFILDALKKSESARQRDNWHDSAQIASGSSKPSTSRWLIFVGVLLVVNVLVLLVVLLKPEQTRTEGAPTTATAQPIPVISASRSRDGPAITTRRDPPPPQPVLVEVQAAQKLPPHNQPATDSQGTTTTAGAPAPKITPRTVATVYPSFNEVRVNGSLQLPDLHLDIHVYSEDAIERFVFINMNKYTENATLGEGPMVTEIVPEGVVLDYLGTRFLLPRE